VDVRLRMVPQAAPSGMVRDDLKAVAGGLAPLRHNQSVDFFSGAAEVPARLRLLDAEQLQPGGSGWAQLRLAAPVALKAGDHFIIRQPSPSMTVGGGQVVNPHPRRRWRRFQPEVIAQFETLARGTPEDLLLHTLGLYEPAPLKIVAERSGLDAASSESTLTALIAGGQVLLFGSAQPPLVGSGTPAVSIDGWNNLSARLERILTDYHAQYPLRPGIGREEMKNRLQGRDKWQAKLFNELIARGVTESVVEEAGECLCRPGYRITFTPEQQTRVDALLAAFRRLPYTPPSTDESTVLVDTEIISALIYQGRLIRLNEDVLFLGETYEEIAARIVAFINEHGSMTVAQVRDMFSTSRKYALALMEYLDGQKVTRRVGDERVLR
jgi:selenocysteine-specific elongation factor